MSRKKQGDGAGSGSTSASSETLVQSKPWWWCVCLFENAFCYIPYITHTIFKVKTLNMPKELYVVEQILWRHESKWKPSKKISIYIECKGVQFEKCSGSFYCKSTIINNGIIFLLLTIPWPRSIPVFWGQSIEAPLCFSPTFSIGKISQQMHWQVQFINTLKYIGHLCSIIYTGLETRNVRKLLSLYCWQFRSIKCWQHITDIKDIFF